MKENTIKSRVEKTRAKYLRYVPMYHLGNVYFGL